jgi:hypothetical protein
MSQRVNTQHPEKAPSHSFPSVVTQPQDVVAYEQRDPPVEGYTQGGRITGTQVRLNKRTLLGMSSPQVNLSSSRPSFKAFECRNDASHEDPSTAGRRVTLQGVTASRQTLTWQSTL